MAVQNISEPTVPLNCVSGPIENPIFVPSSTNFIPLLVKYDGLAAPLALIIESSGIPAFHIAEQTYAELKASTRAGLKPRFTVILALLVSKAPEARTFCEALILCPLLYFYFDHEFSYDIDCTL